MAKQQSQVKKPKTVGDTAKPVHSVRKIKNQFIDFDPTTETSMYRESVDERLDYLIRIGLGDPAKLAYYRTALSDPRAAVLSALYRDMAAHALSRLIELVLSDPILYNRLRTLLLARGSSMTVESVIEAGLELRSNK